MDVNEQSGGWNPIVVLALHCHNVQKSLLQTPKPPPYPSVSSNAPHDHSTNSLVSALTAMKKGMPPAVLTLFRNNNNINNSSNNSNERENSNFSCSCSGRSSGSKAFLGVSIPNSGLFGGFDHTEKAIALSCSFCEARRDSMDMESRSPKPFLGFNLQGFSIAGFNKSGTEQETTTTTTKGCCCAKGRMMENQNHKVDIHKEAGMDASIINVSIMVMSMFGQEKQGDKEKEKEREKGKPIVHFQHNNNSVCKLPECSSSIGQTSSARPVKDNDLHPLLQIPVFGFLSQHLSRQVIQKPSTKCDRKRSCLVCACGNREEEGTNDLSRRKAAKRPFLGIFLASFMQPKVPAIEFLVANGKKRMRTTRLASLGFARLQGEPEGSTRTVVVPDEVRDEVIVETGSLSEKLKSTGLQPIQVKLPNMEGLRSSLSTLSVKELVDRVTELSKLGKSAQDYPDKKKLTSVQDFFRYTEAEGETTVNESMDSCC